MLLLRRADLGRLGEWARLGYPHESCGLLLGRSRCERVDIERVTAARNLNRERSRDRFELDPEHLLAADREARSQSLEVLGVWHSHPDHPAVPSETDRAQAWEGWSYAIVPVRAGTRAAEVGELRSWRLATDRFHEESVQIMSRATIRIPTPLRSFTGGLDEVCVEGATVREALAALGARHDGVLARVVDAQGGTRPFVNLFLGEKNVRTLGGLDTPLGEDSVLSIIPAVAGGVR